MDGYHAYLTKTKNKKQNKKGRVRKVVSGRWSMHVISLLRALKFIVEIGPA